MMLNSANLLDVVKYSIAISFMVRTYLLNVVYVSASFMKCRLHVYMSMMCLLNLLVYMKCVPSCSLSSCMKYQAYHEHVLILLSCYALWLISSLLACCLFLYGMHYGSVLDLLPSCYAPWF